jgi:hypothetical protein
MDYILKPLIAVTCVAVLGGGFLFYQNASHYIRMAECDRALAQRNNATVSSCTKSGDLPATAALKLALED